MYFSYTTRYHQKVNFEIKHMSKHLFLVTALLFTALLTTGQVSFAIEPELSTGILAHKYSNDSLIPSNRKSTGHIGTFTYAGALISFQSQKSKWKFFTGIGYQTNRFTIHKQNGVDNIFSFFDLYTSVWDQDPDYDRYPYNTVKLKNNNLVIPLGFLFTNNRQGKKGIQTQLGLRTNLNFAVNGKASIKFVADSTNTSQASSAEKSFIDLYRPFTISAMPFLCFTGSSNKKLKWQFTWLPLIFYTNSQIPRIYNKEIGSSISLSASYSL